MIYQKLFFFTLLCTIYKKTKQKVVSKPSAVAETRAYFPVRPSHSLTDLSNEALASRRVSGEKRTSLTSCWWPAMRDTHFLSASGCHRKSVKSSEPDTSRSASSPCRRGQRSAAVGAKVSRRGKGQPPTILGQILRQNYILSMNKPSS